VQLHRRRLLLRLLVQLLVELLVLVLLLLLLLRLLVRLLLLQQLLLLLLRRLLLLLLLRRRRLALLLITGQGLPVGRAGVWPRVLRRPRAVLLRRQRALATAGLPMGRRWRALLPALRRRARTAGVAGRRVKAGRRRAASLR
jgi:hypothetical protein